MAKMAKMAKYHDLALSKTVNRVASPLFRGPKRGSKLGGVGTRFWEA